MVGANTGEVIGSAPDSGPTDIDAAVTAAREALSDPAGWAHTDPDQRAAALERLADSLERRAVACVRCVSAQNGMPVSVARQLEGVFPSVLLRYYAALIREHPVEETRRGLFGGDILVRRQPVGVVAAMVPWNFPQTLAAFKYAPALAAGCAVVLKPSPEAPLDSYLLAQAVTEAGLPPGVINIVPGSSHAGEYLVAHPGVDKIAFTGSTRAGRHIGATSGRLLRPATLELGGKSATIILDDAELDEPAVTERLFTATLLNNGQTCFLGTRVLIPQTRYHELVDLFTDFARSLTLGCSLDDATQIGPLATAAHRDRVEAFIAAGHADGARLTTGGKRPARFTDGWFLEPTVFVDVANHHTIAREEIFGPVLSLITYTDEQDAVRLANASEYGLAGTVWSSDPDRGLAVARQIHTGTVGVNTYLPDPVAPFGGVKASGLGRELGPEGLSAYQQYQTIYL